MIERDFDRVIITFGVFIVVLLFLDLSFSIYQKNLAREVISKEDYAIYIDGQKIDLSNININDYQIIIDNDSKKIILSNKR